jgi:peptidoglycan/LPS O-acetylase OafA/YrhL
MPIPAAAAFFLLAGLAAAWQARRLPARGWAALALAAGLVAAAFANRLPSLGTAAVILTFLPPLGLYYLLGSC